MIADDGIQMFRFGQHLILPKIFDQNIQPMSIILLCLLLDIELIYVELFQTPNLSIVKQYQLGESKSRTSRNVGSMHALDGCMCCKHVWAMGMLDCLFIFIGPRCPWGPIYGS